MPHYFSMLDNINYTEVRRLMIVEYVLKVRVNNYHIIPVIIGHCSILFLHSHILCFLMTSLLSDLKDINALPSYMWIHIHIMDFATQTRIQS